MCVYDFLKFLEMDSFTLESNFFQFPGDDELGFSKKSRIDSCVEFFLERGFALVHRDEISVVFSKNKKK